MTGGPIFPSSIYLGGASGNLSPTFYGSSTGTTAQSYIEGIGVVASLAAEAAAALQFNLPELIPSGTFKCRILAWSNASSGTAVLTLSDGQTAVGSNIGSTVLTAEAQYSTAWTAVDNIVESKISLSTSPVANDILTVLATFNHTSWTLAQTSVWQFSLVWE